MDILRILFVLLHVVCAGIWIAQFPAGLFMSRLARKNAGTSSAAALFMAHGDLLQYLGQIGGIGILVSGLLLLFVDHLGLFGLGGFTPKWLMVMEGVYIIAMIVVGAYIIPNSIKLRKMTSGATGSPSAEAVALNQRIDIGSYLINILVLINIVMGVWRPQ